MTMWQEAWQLARYDFKRFKWYYMIILIMAVFLGLNTTVLMHGRQEPNFVMDRYVRDLYFILVVPALGCPWYTAKFSQSTFNQIRLCRTLPISVRGVVLSRMLLVVLRMIPNAVLFFGPLYLLSAELRDMLDPLGYLLFILIWLGYTLALSGWYPYWELISQNKLYIWVYSFGFSIVIVAMAVVLWFGLHVQIVQFVVEQGQSHRWLSALMSLVIGFLCFSFWGRLAKRKIEQGIF